MIRQVEITRRAEKQLRRLPVHVGEKLLHWVYLMYRLGREGDVDIVSVEEVTKHGY